MGATSSSPGIDTAVNKLMVAAVSHVVHFDKEQLERLQSNFEKVAEETQDSPFSITRVQFDDAAELSKIHPRDKEMMDRIFILNDLRGEGCVNYKEFMTCVAMLINTPIRERLRFVLQLYDADKVVGKADFVTILGWMKNCAGYFGDRTIKEEAIDQLAEEVFETIEEKGDESSTAATEIIESMASHQIVMEFLHQVEDSKFLVSKKA